MSFNPLYLNLASGSDYRPGWANLDIVDWPGYPPADIKWDARRDPIPFPDDSAAGVYCGYTIMHLAPCYHGFLLSEVHRVLSPVGTLVVGEVDMEVVFRRWLLAPFDQSLCELIWGEQGSIHGAALAEFDKHCWGFTETTLRALLEKAGFHQIRRISVHHPDVFYELTLTALKQSRHAPPKH